MFFLKPDQLHFFQLVYPVQLLLVQRECPSGAGLHAISIRRASARPSSLRLALSELMFRYKVTMPSIPFVEYSFTVLVIVARHTALDFADCSWVRTFP